MALSVPSGFRAPRDLRRAIRSAVLALIVGVPGGCNVPRYRQQ